MRSEECLRVPRKCFMLVVGDYKYTSTGTGQNGSEPDVTDEPWDETKRCGHCRLSISGLHN